MEWPQITYLVLLGVSGGINIIKHGTPREDYDFGSWVFGCCIILPLLYFGGFFK